MSNRRASTDHNWQLQHYADIGKDYGDKHFTQAESEFTEWILGQISSVHPAAQAIAEIGAGTCVFASLLGGKLDTDQPVTCYEPVAALLEAADYGNIDVTCGGGVEFAREAPANAFDLVFTKDTAHHFALDTLDEIHRGVCEKLVPGGRYAMVVRTPPRADAVPVGQIAAAQWPALYTSAADLLRSLRSVDGWRELNATRWEKYVSTPVADWLDGIRRRDTWSVFSALSSDEIDATIQELEQQFDEEEWFPFLHQYDVAIFEKI